MVAGSLRCTLAGPGTASASAAPPATGDRSMTRWITIGGGLIAGLLPGLLLAGSTGAAIGAATGGAMGLLADRANVRPVVAISVIGGTVTGAFVGAAIAALLCQPSSCLGVEIAAGVITGVGAFFGVGMIAALTARSFDEYRAAVAANRPPPTTGCGPSDDSGE